jgi:NTE family protein
MEVTMFVFRRGRRAKFRRSLSFFLMLTLCVRLGAQESEPAKRPRIGVALSGGGARGLAHIGVLQWMEENRIPVDYVAGTSMGALVGSLYATGMSPAEMRQFVESIDWDQALLPEPGYDQLAFRRKEDRLNYQVAIPLGFKHGLAGPNGFNPGHGVGLILDRIAFPYSTVPSFDDLPIPFRCVATDMLNGDAVVLKEGSLAESLRASMSLPGVFTPVELNGKTLADGGLVNNIPTDVARQMGGEVVIAVDIGTPLGGHEELQSVGGVLDQTISVMTIDHDRRSLRQADIVVAPDLGQYTREDYYATDKLIELGYHGAEQKAAVLRAFALPEEEWQQYLAARYARKRAPETSAHVLQITGASRYEEQQLRNRLKRYLNTNLDTARLATDLTRITGEGRFDSLGYEGLVQSGTDGLRINAHEKTYGPPFVDLAVNVSGSGVGDFNFATGVRVLFMDVRHQGGEWRSDLLLGSTDIVATEFYQPLGQTRFFVSPYMFFLNQGRNAFVNDQRVALYREQRGGGGFDFGFNTGRTSEIRLGYRIFEGDLAPLIGNEGLPRIHGSSSQIRLGYVFDDLDNPGVPGRGERLTSELVHVLQSPGVNQNFNQLQVQSLTFVPLGTKSSLFFNVSGGTTFHRDAGLFQIFSLGGPFRLGAYSRDEFLGNHYALATLGFRRELYRLPVLLGSKVYWGGWYEEGTAFNDPSTVVAHGSFNAGVIADTLFGPIGLSGAVSPSGHTKINFSIGRLF